MIFKQKSLIFTDVHACLAKYYRIKAVWELELSVLEKCVILFFAQVNGLSLLAVIYAYSYSLVLMGVIIWTVLESFRILLFKQLQRGFNKLKQEKAGRQETDRQERGRFHLNYIHQVSAFRQDYIKAVVRVARWVQQLHGQGLHRPDGGQLSRQSAPPDDAHLPAPGHARLGHSGGHLPPAGLLPLLHSPLHCAAQRPA